MDIAVRVRWRALASVLIAALIASASIVGVALPAHAAVGVTVPEAPREGPRASAERIEDLVPSAALTSPMPEAFRQCPTAIAERITFPGRPLRAGSPTVANP